MNNLLFTSYKLGRNELPNRLVMAPLTRNRAGEGNVPTPLMAEYYAQRASAGLIIAEATQVSPDGQGYENTPGIHSEAQVQGWRHVTDAVHGRGGRIYLQLWHVGRISHTSLQPDQQAPLAPSALRAKAQTFVKGAFVDVSEPRAIAEDEIPRLIEAYRTGARNAVRAGFDGVEIHGANGYLIDQFLRDKTNRRTDIYGGRVENRTRFLLDVAAAVTGAIGADRTGIRLSPVTSFGDIADSDPQGLFNHVVTDLDRLELSYIHVIEGETGNRSQSLPFDYEQLRRRFRGAYIANNEFALRSATEALETRHADLVCFGRPFIANPDLVERLRRGAELNPVDPNTLYGGGEHGYTDYPALSA